MLCSMLKLPFATKGGLGKEEEDRGSLMSNPSVKEEYKEAFRTKSYIDICNKVQDLVRVTSVDKEELAVATSSSLRLMPSPSPSRINHIHLSQYLLEPYHKPSTSVSDSSNFHHFFVNYFDISLEACRICESLLANINQARKNHLRIKKAIKIIRRLSDSEIRSSDEHHVLYKNLASFAAKRNPFSTTTTTEKFLDLHETHVVVFQELTATCRKLKRRRKMIRLIKKAMASFVLMGFGALVIVALVLAMHCTAGLVAAPGLVMLALMVKKMKRAERQCNDKWLEEQAAKLDVAARGVFIMINDLATMSQIVKKLEDEIEHRRFVADVCVRKGKSETVKEVVREFQMHESLFMEELEELEKQIYLCFLDINRSRMLL
ncbi:hypothetical protein C2S52_011458, partial [Perilla frutescens var. hirtella]